MKLFKGVPGRIIAAFGFAIAISLAVAPQIKADNTNSNSGNLNALGAAVWVGPLYAKGSCTATLVSGLVGTVTLETASNISHTNPQNVTGYPDAGSSSNGSQTITNPGNVTYTVSVPAQEFFGIVVTGYTSGAANGASINCSGSDFTAPGGGGGGQITVGPTPLPVLTPAPAPTGPHGGVGTEGCANYPNCTPQESELQSIGSNGNQHRLDQWDTMNSSSSIITATTTTVITQNSTKTTYIRMAGVVAMGTESAATYQYVMSATIACPSGNTVLFDPNTITAPAANQNVSEVYGGSPGTGSAVGFSPAATAFPVPPGFYVCIITAGTTIDLQPVIYYSQHVAP